MKRISTFICFLILIFFASNSLGNTQFQDSVQAYTYWSKRGVVEMVYAYMQDYCIEKQSVISDKEIKGCEIYKQKYIVLDSLFQFYSNLNLDDINQFLKSNGWEKIATLLLDSLELKIEKKLPLDSHFFEIKTNHNNNELWNSKKSSVLKAYSNSIIRVDTINSTQPENIRMLKSESKDFLIYYFLWFSCGLLLGGIIVSLYTKHKILKVLKNENLRENTDYSSENIDSSSKVISEILALKKRKNHYKNEAQRIVFENNAIKSDNIKLIQNNKELQTEIEKLLIINKKTGNQNDEKSISIKTPIDNTSVVFFTIPELDGSFNSAYLKETHEQDCFYKILVDNTKMRGKLYFICSEYDQRAIDNINNYLEPACEILNINDLSSAKRIQQIEPGDVSLHGNIWRIEHNKKVKIKLI